MIDWKKTEEETGGNQYDFENQTKSYYELVYSVCPICGKAEWRSYKGITNRCKMCIRRESKKFDKYLDNQIKYLEKIKKSFNDTINLSIMNDNVQTNGLCICKIIDDQKYTLLLTVE